MQPLFTQRLILRPFCPSDVQPFVSMNRDPEVMHHFPAPLSLEESTALLQRFELHHREHGFGMLAIEVPNVAPFVGFVGLTHTSFDAPFTPGVEFAWRLSRPHWSQGFASEAASALLPYAFSTLKLTNVVAFTARDNVRSIRVMQRLNMDYGGEFEHPRLPEGHPLRRHVWYRLHASVSNI